MQVNNATQQPSIKPRDDPLDYPPPGPASDSITARTSQASQAPGRPGGPDRPRARSPSRSRRWRRSTSTRAERAAKALARERCKQFGGSDKELDIWWDRDERCERAERIARRTSLCSRRHRKVRTGARTPTGPVVPGDPPAE